MLEVTLSRELHTLGSDYCRRNTPHLGAATSHFTCLDASAVIRTAPYCSLELFDLLGGRRVGLLLDHSSRETSPAQRTPFRRLGDRQRHRRAEAPSADRAAPPLGERHCILRDQVAPPAIPHVRSETIHDCLSRRACVFSDQMLRYRHWKSFIGR